MHEDGIRRPAGRSAVRPAVLLALVLLATSACTRSAADLDTLFTRLDEQETGITFVNYVEDTPGFNILDYLYFYDGGGVALGDVNNDGLVDIFFTGNQSSNRLYLNRGGMAFEDVTTTAGVGGGAGKWSTGVTMADVDGDGWLDIYVCQVNYGGATGRNLLYINNRDDTFTEQAEAYGLDFEGLSTQAAFFDYDLDGDLDLYLLNHSVHTRDSFVESWRRIIDAPRVGDRLYRNDGARFVNVTDEAGIYSSTLGYGLGLAVSDVNFDGWPDLYVGNDFHENDYLYFNNGDGTFSERLQHVIGHTSQSSMGNDVADFNNDGQVDIVSLDMLPADVSTYRKSGGPDADELARIKQSFGYAPQYARNTLQLNRGFGPDGLPLFSEIGAAAGILATDWSWAGLFADLDNDGWKDLYVTNGILRRPNDLDYVAYVSRPEVQRVLNGADKEEQLRVTERMPSAKIPNYVFANNRDLTFSDRSAEWGLATPAFSNGAAYGDLDNDGDVDLVVNNINDAAFIYRNNADTLRGAHYLSVRLEGEGRNTTGIGTKVLIYVAGQQLYQEHMPTRGFQSSVSHRLHFGLGNAGEVDSLLVIWPDGRFQRLHGVGADRELTLRQGEAQGSFSYDRPGSGLLRDASSTLRLDYVHRENDFADDEHQPLIPHKLSTQGPALAVADVNGDGLDDLYLGGAHHQAGALLMQRRDGGTVPVSGDIFRESAESEDVDAAFFDADADGDLDLYVVSGGGEYAEGSAVLRDRLYLNSGTGSFARSDASIPELARDGCCVAPADFDGDGDIDLFVGSRSVPGSYGKAPSSHLLENDGTGTFRDVTDEKAAMLRGLGMVTDATWSDVDTDGRADLVLVGEWMPITVLKNTGGKLTDVTDDVGLRHTGGWWNSILADDFDGDGDADLVAGNLGRNAVLRASESTPLELFVHDFDGNGSSDPVLVEQENGARYAWARRDELQAQIPAMASKIPTYASYAGMTLADLFEPAALENADRRSVHTLASAYFENGGPAGFERHELPIEAQFAPIMDLVSRDVDGDGMKDILAVGNFYGSDTKQGRYDADFGLLLAGVGLGRFEARSLEESGFVVRGEGRRIEVVSTANDGWAIVVARNGDAPVVFRVDGSPLAPDRALTAAGSGSPSRSAESR